VELDVTSVATAVVPYVTAAVGVYGAGVIARIQEAAADATVGVGGRLLRRLLGRPESAQALSGAVQDLAVDPADEDRIAALRLQIRKILAADAEIAADVARLVGHAEGAVTASGERSVAARTISGVVVTGDGAQIVR
jgi:hypothetical protein